MLIINSKNYDKILEDAKILLHSKIDDIYYNIPKGYTWDVDTTAIFDWSLVCTALYNLVEKSTKIHDDNYSEINMFNIGDTVITFGRKGVITNKKWDSAISKYNYSVKSNNLNLMNLKSIDMVKCDKK